MRIAKLRELLAQAEPIEASEADTELALLAGLLDLPMEGVAAVPDLSPQLRKQRTQEALMRQVLGLAARKPVLLASG